MTLTHFRYERPTIPEGSHWAFFRPLITELYRDQGRSLQEVKSYMLQHYNLRATDRMYKKRLSDWNVTKSLRHSDLDAVSRQIAVYKETNGTAPDVLEINGRTFSSDKLQRSLRRHRVRKRRQPSDSSTPLVSAQSAPEIIPVTICTIQTRIVDNYLAKRIRIADLLCDAIPAEEEDLTSEELTALSVAILQTDYHGQNTEFQDFLSAARLLKGGSGVGIGSDATRHRKSRCPWPCQNLSDPQELHDLRYVLFQSDSYYEYLETLSAEARSHRLECSPIEKTRARDFYARHWLGLSLAEKGQFNHAFGLLHQAHAQVELVLVEHHPHFLPWVCFMVCYPVDNGPSSNKGLRIQAESLSFVSAMTEALAKRNDPRRKILEILELSRFRREICLRLLRQVIALFRQETQDEHLQSLQLLAKLFDKIDQHEHFDGWVIEETLEMWAQRSFELAQIIQQTRERKPSSSPV